MVVGRRVDPSVWTNPLVAAAFERYKQPGSDLQTQHQLVAEIARITGQHVNQSSVSRQLNKYQQSTSGNVKPASASGRSNSKHQKAQSSGTENPKSASRIYTTVKSTGRCGTLKSAPLPGSDQPSDRSGTHQDSNMEVRTI